MKKDLFAPFITSASRAACRLLLCAMMLLPLAAKAAAPAVFTLDANGISPTSATLRATVTPLGAVTTAYFQYGLTTNYGIYSATTNLPAATNTTFDVSNLITGLSPVTTYHFRIVGTNSAGTAVGADVTFTTGAIQGPAVFTFPATGVTPTNATLNGTVNAGGAATTAYFQYGLTTNYGSFSASNSVAAGTGLTVSNVVTGLSPGMTYHFRIVGTSSAGTDLGNDLTLTTGTIPPPGVTTFPATGVTPTNATLNGTVNAGGAATTAYFQYGLTTNYGSYTASNSLAAGTILSVTNLVTGLSPGTIYHFRFVGTSSAGTGLGADVTLTTRVITPAAATLAASAVTATNATLNGLVNPGGAATTAYFQYGLTTNYGSYSATNSLAAGNTALSVSNLITGLSPGTLYHFRIVGANSAGASRGADLTFSTLGVATLPASGVTATSATLNGTVNPNGAATTAYFQYGLTTNYGSYSATNSLSATNAALFVSNLISGFTPGTLYHFRIVGINSAGTNLGADLSFTTTVGDVDLLDAQIGPNDWFIRVEAMAVQPDGKIIIGGQFTSVQGLPSAYLARLNADGTLDTSFDPRPNSVVQLIQVQPDGKILIGGLFHTLQPNGGVLYNRNFVARLNADGTLDTGFDPRPELSVTFMGVQPDGKVYIAGLFQTLRPNGGALYNSSYVARLNADGTLDTSFDPRANSYVNSVAVQADGKLLLSGGFTTFQPNGGALYNRSGIARLNADGTVDPSFDPRPDSGVAFVAVQADGRILVSGDFTTFQPNGGAVYSRANVARLNADGTVDTDFTPNPDGLVTSLVLQADGKILCGGRFSYVTGVHQSFLARLNADGTLDSRFELYPNNWIYGAALQADGKVLLGGPFTLLNPNGAGPIPRNAFARVLNDPASQTLNAPNGTQVSWIRGGSSPELTSVTFEWSTNNGVNWTPLGNGTRIGATASWELTGLGLIGSGKLRARGRTVGGTANASSGLMESSATFSGLTITTMALSGNGVTITNGDTSSSITDGTDFGTVPAAGGSIVHTFTITNSGPYGLILSNIIVTGSTPADFTINQQPPVLLAPGGRTNFQVTFNPANGGVRSATLSITNNDPMRNPFNFSVQGTRVAPEIAVSGNGVNIADGDSTPRASDGTDFGNLITVGNTLTRTFIITNSGVTSLALGALTVGGTNASDFTVATQPAGTVAAGGVSSFQVTFNPSAVGLRTATLSFTNNDADENPFNFSIQGTGFLPIIAVTGNGIDITNGDSTPGTGDGTDFGSTNTVSSTMHTFTISNQGSGMMTLGNVLVSGSNSANYVVSAQPATSLPAGASTTFQVTFSPTAVGLRSATLSLTNNDPSANPFSCNIQGTGFISSNPNLSTLTNSAGTLTPVFAPTTTNYTINLLYRALTITPTAADSASTIQVRVNGGSFATVASGSPSGLLSLNGGANAVEVRVTAQNGTAIKTYTITVNLTLTPGDLDGLLDAQIGPNDWFIRVESMAVQPDGKTIIGGQFTDVLGMTRAYLARLNADGTLDSSFDPRPDAIVQLVEVQSDGKILIAGGFHNLQPNGGTLYNRGLIARLNADGTLDSTFDPRPDASVTFMALQPDGKVYIAGAFHNFQPNGGPFYNSSYLARLNADGTLDNSFDPRANSYVNNVAVQADGKLLLGGDFTTLQPNGGALYNRSSIARLNADGTVDASFDPRPDNGVNIVTVQPDGRILVCGAFTAFQPNGGAVYNRANLARLNADGTVDTSFAPNPNNLVTSLPLQADGKILCGGRFSYVTGVEQEFFARLNANGTLDSNFDPRPNNWIYGAALQADGKVLLGGPFTWLAPSGTGPIPRNAFARMLNDPATQTLSAPNGTQVSWTRSGSAPELTYSTFEWSTNNGVNWTLLGNGTRIGATANWELTGLGLVGSGKLRARGRTVGGTANASSGLVESIASFSGLTAPEIVVRGNAINIADGDSTPSAADFTDFGSVPVGGGTVVRVFTVTNSGAFGLVLGNITIGGPDAAEFSVTQQPATNVVPGGSTTFQVTFNPGSGGLRSAALSFTNNDADENPFNFSIQGTRLSPEIAVSGSTVNIPDGDTTPSTTDGTDFGNTGTGGGNVVRTFTITNSGVSNLTLGAVTISGANAADFAVNAQPTNSVVPTGSTIFQVTFAPNAVGLRTATINFTNNDANENPFNFNIQGTGIVASTNANLSALALSVGTLAPSFAPAITNYTASAPFPDLTITATAADTNSTVQLRVNGGSFTNLASGSPSGLLALSPGANTLEVRVTAQGGITIKTYTMTVTVNFAPGDLDALDLMPGAGTVVATALQPDGKIIVAGAFTSVLGVPRSYIARLNADGTLDTGFDPHPNFYVNSVAVQPDGKIVLGGQFATLKPNGAPASTPRSRIARVNADGTLDIGFDPSADQTVNTVAEQADGKLLLGGAFTTLQPNGGAVVSRQYLARLNADGTLDTGFDPRPNTVVNSVAVQPDGKLLFGGGFSTLQPNGGALVSRLHLARLNGDGTVDTGFDPRPNQTVAMVALQPDAKVLVGGFFTTFQPNGGPSINRQYFARLNADGTLDAGFDPKPNNIVYTTAVQADGKLLFGGNFTTLQPNGGALISHPYVARVRADGTLDAGFDPQPNNTVTVLALQANGRVLFGGSFTTLQPNGAVSATSRNGFARLLNDPASQALNAPDGTQVSWTRSGSAPECNAVTFEWSTNSGQNWMFIGDGTRVGANWQLNGLNLIGSGQFRARGRTSGGFYNASFGLVESVASFTNLAVPEIAVSGNGVNIVDGDNSPTNSDYTDFGGVALAGGAVVRTFTVVNNGGSTLTLGSVTLGGSHPADFTVSAQPAASVAGGGSTSFRISFAPSAIGLRSATLSFTNNDVDENPFNFSIQGTGLAPEISVSGNGLDIANGDNTPGVADRTDFGSIAAAGGAVIHAFTIVNSGNDNLTLGNLTVGGFNASDFSVTAPPTTPVAPGGSTSFQITFAPRALGLRSATISFSNNDANENPFSFSIQGIGVNAAPAISHTTNQVIAEDSPTGALAVTIGDALTAASALILSGNSTNQTLVPNASIVFGGSGSNRTVTITPAANKSGTTSITLTVSDGTLASTDSFLLTVYAVNDLPMFTKGPGQLHPYGTTNTQTFVGWATGIDDGDPEVTQALTFNLTNSNPGLFTTPPSVSPGGTLTYTPKGTSGVAILGVSLTDDATAGGPALTTPVQTFTITVTAAVVPVPPVINSAIVLSSGAFQFAFSNANNVAFNVLAATDISQPASNWTVLGLATNLGGGLYQFTDPQATNYPIRFYRLRYP